VATVQARFAIAYRKPRDLDSVRVGLLKECRRAGFAEVAKYHKPIGKGVQGPSIRFVEAALRHYSNILQETSTIYDDETKRIVRVSVTDLEANATYEQEITVSKLVERRKLADGQVPVSSRTNSSGQIVYTIQATDDDLINKEGALRSKAIRTLGLRLLPGDLVDESMDLVERTLSDKAAKDPDAERRKLVDAFVLIGVQPKDLTSYLGHDLAQCTPTEVVGLRKIYAAIRDGEAKWIDYIETTQPAEEDKERQAKTDALRAKLANRRPLDTSTSDIASEPSTSGGSGA
jgi:hypothetical protein